MAPTYTVDFKQATVAQVQAGSTVVDVAAVTGVHERTIRKWLQALAEGKSLKAGRPGPKTFLPKAAEDHLYDWVVGRQLIGHPVERAVIIRKAQEVGLLGCGERVGQSGSVTPTLPGGFTSHRRSWLQQKVGVASHDA
ncbi:hypothetical protein PPTG_23844 [Phytophthora nicotianae INRA-310]|uniref:HTH psq-type domain-containing protein n=1 Tax=Phytophthora nicotianae (strain INRA-310) TaxID=761204 RepID=W2PPB7_PHYN3|nr:hypothetical protein PPTG_23844 [Phytophthora nicotianae INRA-310]ETN02813.1 hypothetical protein PPTG_23844 [Phytophthora nicotianae INRA-310]